MSYSIMEDTMYFNESFDKPIDSLINFITNNITGIDLSKADDFNHPIDKLSEKNIIVLSLGRCFAHSLDNLPSTLKILNMEFNENFNEPIDNLPNNLECLKLGYNFNQPLNNLPESLKVLWTSCHFNQPLDNLPNRLINLRTGGDFIQPLDNLPNSLQVLEIGEQYKHSLEKLPESIKFLTICSDSARTINYLPPNLETLVLKYVKQYYIDSYIIPKTLNQIILIESNIVNYYNLLIKYPHIQIVEDYGFAR